MGKSRILSTLFMNELIQDSKRLLKGKSRILNKLSINGDYVAHFSFIQRMICIAPLHEFYSEVGAYGVCRSLHFIEKFRSKIWR